MERPPFQECPCELCNCGRHKRHRSCRKQPKSGKGWLSHYKATYTCPPATLPRSSKRPPGTPPHPDPPPMDFQTTQRAEFIAWAPGERLKQHHLQERRYQRPQEPFQNRAPHRLRFPPPEPAAAPPRQLQPHGTLVQHTSSSKAGRQGPKGGGGNDPHPPSHHLGLASAWQRIGTAKPLKQGPAEYMTNYQSDFPARRSFPAQMAPVLPPLDNLAINRALSTSFETVQRESYRNWDASAYSRDKPTTLEGHQGKGEGAAVTKLSYHHPPVLVKRVEPTEQPATTQKPLAARFDACTAHKFFFRDWGAQPRVRHGDPWEGIHPCAMGSFESQPTSSPYVPKKTEETKSFKPESKPIVIEGKRDFATVHQEAYRPIPTPCGSLANVTSPSSRSQDRKQILIQPKCERDKRKGQTSELTAEYIGY